jgi:hypothetical protein
MQMENRRNAFHETAASPKKGVSFRCLHVICNWLSPSDKRG